MTTKHKSRLPSSTPAPWSAIGERNVAEMIRLADEGNTDAGCRLVRWAARCMRDRQPLPETLREWLAVQLEAVSETPAQAGKLLRVIPARGRPPKHATDVHDHLELEVFKDRVAWAVFWAVAAKEGPTKENRAGTPTVFELVSKWASQNGGRRCSPKQAKRWYEERLERMRVQQAEVDEIRKTLDS